MTSIEVDEATVVGMLDRLARVKHEKSICEAEEKRLADAVKSFLQLNRGTLDLDRDGRPQLVDGENGVRVYLAERMNTSWDTEHMEDDVLLELKRRGLLSVNTTAYDKLRRTAANALIDRAERYRMQGATDALMVERIEKP